MSLPSQPGNIRHPWSHRQEKTGSSPSKLALQASFLDSVTRAPDPSRWALGQNLAMSPTPDQSLTGCTPRPSLLSLQDRLGRPYGLWGCDDLRPLAGPFPLSAWRQVQAKGRGDPPQVLPGGQNSVTRGTDALPHLPRVFSKQTICFPPAEPSKVSAKENRLQTSTEEPLALAQPLFLSVVRSGGCGM